MNKSVEEIYNRVINHAINLGLEADQFLRCWNEGDWNGCREFDFELLAFDGIHNSIWGVRVEIDNSLSSQIDAVCHEG